MKLDDLYDKRQRSKVPSEWMLKSINNLFDTIQFITTGKDVQLMLPRLRERRLAPTMKNIKRYLVWNMLRPINTIPEPERTIIYKSGLHRTFR